MSFSAANMCRFVIVVIFISFVSCVLAKERTPDSTTNKTEICNDPRVKKSYADLNTCFNMTVLQHLYSTIVPKPGDCQNASDFGINLNDHFNTIKNVCNYTTADPTNFMKFVDFSLKNDSFNKFYSDIACVKNLELNISNTCVKQRVGFFNITNDRKHTRWMRKTNLHYNSDTCGTTNGVKNCVVDLLKDCQNETREYVASLFNYARELGDCTRLEKNTPTIPPPSGNMPLPAAPLMTKPVIITLSIGGVIVVIAIIIIIVLKYQHLKD